MVHAICPIRAGKCCNRAQIIWLQGRRTHKGRLVLARRSLWGGAHNRRALDLHWGLLLALRLV